MIMCVLLCYPVSIRIYYQQGGLFLVFYKLVYISHLTSNGLIIKHDYWDLGCLFQTKCPVLIYYNKYINNVVFLKKLAETKQYRS